jgi:hypothetical protein
MRPSEVRALAALSARPAKAAAKGSRKRASLRAVSTARAAAMERAE